MISLYCWNKAQKAGLLLNPELLRTHIEQFRNSRDVYWIDMEDPTEEEETLVFETFVPIHRLTRQDITQRHRQDVTKGHLPKVEEFPDYLFVVVNPLHPNFLEKMSPTAETDELEADGAVAQLSAVLTRSVLITHHREPVRAISDLHAFLEKHEEQADRGPDYLFHLVLDAMVDEFAPVLDRFQDALESLEDRVFANPDREMLHQLLAVKRNIFHMRKTLVYEREILARLVRGDFDIIDEREIAYYRNVYDHVVRFTELIESSREMVNDLMQTHLSATSNKLNEVMKVLTMISTIILPMTLIAGIYGMNFQDMPELRWQVGYPAAVGLMLAAGVGALLFFRWKKWI